MNSGKKDILKLQNIVEEKKEKPIQEIPKIQFIPKPSPVREISRLPVQKKIEQKKVIKPIQPTRMRPIIQRPSMRPSNKMLFIPEPTLPKHLEYLKPLPPSSAEEKVEIDLGKLNILLKDPAVKIIEGSPEERVRVMGAMGTRMTDIILTKDEVDIIIKKFSDISKIPTIEGIYRVVVGNLILSAIISEVVGSRFVIKKMPNQPVQQPQQMPQKISPKNEIIPRK